jgi:HK97 family phage major capsid protein
MEVMRVDIERREKVENAETLLAQPVKRVALSDIHGDPKETTEQRTKKEMEAFGQWVRFGLDGLNSEQRHTMATARRLIDVRDYHDIPAEVRALSTTGSAGGYMIPQGFSNELEKALKAFGGMRQAARLFPTPDGRDIPWPTVDDTSNVGELLAENAAAASQDVTFGIVTLKAYKYSSKVVLVSNELLQDSFFDVNSVLRDLLAERIGRITNTHLTTGDGSGKPKGVVVEAGLGATGVPGETLTMIYEDFVELEHSVDPLYRAGASFMFADSTLKMAKKIKDTLGRPIFVPGVETRAYDTILGYPFVINQDVAAQGVSHKSALFGNFSKYLIRDVQEFVLLRLVERYAEYGQVGFLAFARCDGRAIQPAALKYFINSAT